MTRYIRRGIFLASLVPLLAALIICPGVAYPAEWTNPPEIDMQDCIPVKTSIVPNPLSAVPNDLVLVTSYEEKSDTRKPPEKALYFLQSMLVDQEQQTELVYFTALVVSISTEDHGFRRLLNWVLVDTDDDGQVDQAAFRELEISSSGEKTIVSEAQATNEEMAVLQPYYEEMADNLNSKADSKIPENCNQQATPVAGSILPRSS